MSDKTDALQAPDEGLSEIYSRIKSLDNKLEVVSSSIKELNEKVDRFCGNKHFSNDTIPNINNVTPNCYFDDETVRLTPALQSRTLKVKSELRVTRSLADSPFNVDKSNKHYSKNDLDQLIKIEKIMDEERKEEEKFDEKLDEKIEKFLEESAHIKKFKETTNNNLRVFKSNLDYTLKVLNELKSVFEKANVREVCAEIIDDSEKKITFQLQEYEQQIRTIRLENGKYHLDAMKKNKDLRDELEDYQEFKKLFSVEKENMTKRIEESNRKYESAKEDFQKAEKSHVEFFEEIKEIKKKLIELNGKIINPRNNYESRKSYAFGEDSPLRKFQLAKERNNSRLSEVKDSFHLDKILEKNSTNANPVPQSSKLQSRFSKGGPSAKYHSSEKQEKDFSLGGFLKVNNCINDNEKQSDRSSTSSRKTSNSKIEKSEVKEDERRDKDNSFKSSLKPQSRFSVIEKKKVIQILEKEELIGSIPTNNNVLSVPQATIFNSQNDNSQQNYPLSSQPQIKNSNNSSNAKYLDVDNTLLNADIYPNLRVKETSNKVIDANINYSTISNQINVFSRLSIKNENSTDLKNKILKGSSPINTSFGEEYILDKQAKEGNNSILLSERNQQQTHNQTQLQPSTNQNPNSFVKLGNFRNLSIDYASKMKEVDFPKRETHYMKKSNIYQQYPYLNTSATIMYNGKQKEERERDTVNYTHNKIQREFNKIQVQNNLNNSVQSKTFHGFNQKLPNSKKVARDKNSQNQGFDIMSILKSVN